MNLDDYIYDLYLDCEFLCHLINSTSSKEDQNYFFELLKYKQNKISAVLSPANHPHFRSLPNNYNTQTTLSNQYTEEELSVFNGTNGYPAYVAVDGIIYDVTSSPNWINGSHHGFMAGKNLTKEFYSCHTSKSTLSPYNKVGILVKNK